MVKINIRTEFRFDCVWFGATDYRVPTLPGKLEIFACHTPGVEKCLNLKVREKTLNKSGIWYFLVTRNIIVCLKSTSLLKDKN